MAAVKLAQYLESSKNKSHLIFTKSQFYSFKFFWAKRKNWRKILFDALSVTKITKIRTYIP